MTFILICLVLVVLWLVLVLKKLNENFVTWANRDLRRRS